MLFSSLFVPSRMAAAVDDRAWIQAMLDAEAALARAEAGVGLIPATVAVEIDACCRADRFDVAEIEREARQVGNPAEPLVRALRRTVGREAAQFVHHGATSQDILDTASMLIARSALAIVEEDMAGIAGRLAQLTRDHRETLMPGRTLLQHALPISFGLKTAQWLAGVMRARAEIRRVSDAVLAVQLGGAAGTLASLGDSGPAVLRAFAHELRLAEPELPWHAERSRIAEIGATLMLAAGALDKVALDLTLLAQTEVAEVAEGGDERRGGSSTLPHKRNPVGAVLTRSCVREAQAQSEVLMRSMAQEHERAAGTWQAEWPALSAALAYTGGVAAWLREALDGLEVYPGRMRADLDATGGLVMTESVASALAERLGRDEAHHLVRTLALRAREQGRDFGDVLMQDEAVRGHLRPEEIERAMDPAGYLGSANFFIDRALAAYEASS